MKIFAPDADGTWLIVLDDNNNHIASLPLRSIRPCLFHLSNQLSGLIRTISAGQNLAEQRICFPHRGGGALWLVYSAPLNSHARLEFQEHSSNSSWHDPHAKFRILHTMAMTPRALADLLRQFLGALMHGRLDEVVKSEPQLLGEIGDAVRIYDAEVAKLGPQLSSEQPAARLPSRS